MDLKTLPKTNGKIKLKDRKITLVDVLYTLEDLQTNYVKYVRKDQLDAMTQKSSFDTVSTFILVPEYLTYKDKEEGKIIHMAFANHGLIPYCEYEVLESYKLDSPDFFWDYKISPNQPKAFTYAYNYVFSSDNDACETWEARMNFDEIFDHFVLEGGEDYACFAGFYFILGSDSGRDKERT